jgi:hypothetical protein
VRDSFSIREVIYNNINCLITLYCPLVIPLFPTPHQTKMVI